jgi:hypothetical protein
MVSFEKGDEPSSGRHQVIQGEVLGIAERLESRATGTRCMQVIPQQDGALLIQQPDGRTTYDTGNHSLFATFDGRGGGARVLLTEGHHLGGWRLRLEVDGAPFTFQQGRAIGRLWELSGEQAGVNVEVSTFLEEGAPTVFQEWILCNPSAQSRRVGVELVLDFGPTVGLKRRLTSGLADRIPRLPRLGHLWGEGWAKSLLPSFPRRVQVRADGQIEAQGRVPVFWAATHAPSSVKRRARSIQARYELDVPPGETVEVTWVLSARGPEANREALSHRAEALAEAKAYAHWLSSRLETGDPLLQSLFVAGLHLAVAMFKELPGDFAGLVAGREYAYPPRLYFRDSYWTAQVLLPFRPDLVRRHLLCLAWGIHHDGQCPSAVFAPHLLGGQDGVLGPGQLDWLPDHYDAPAYLLLLLDDYLQATGDWAILMEELPHQPSLWHATQAATHYLMGRDRDGDGLIEKPYKANDWADNVRRSTWVTYDQALYAAALKAATRMAIQCKEDDAAALYRHKAEAARQALDVRLWDSIKGHHVNYRRPGFAEDHFSIDTLTTLYYDLVDEEKAKRMLTAARQLQTRYNRRQPYGDWGVMCVFPPYREPRDLFSISADPYRYHNGADWPYWDGVYADILMRRADPDWRYVLTRWWEYGLEQGWLTPVEYYSPPYRVGGMMNGWSAMPAAVLARRAEDRRETSWDRHVPQVRRDRKQGV